MNLILLPILIGAGALGVALHELTHYLVWRLGGRDVRFDAFEMAAVATIDRVRLRDRVAALAPLVIGSALTPWVIGIGRLTPSVGLLLFFYTLGGVWLGDGPGSDLRVAFYSTSAASASGENVTSSGTAGGSVGSSAAVSSRSRNEN